MYGKMTDDQSNSYLVLTTSVFVIVSYRFRLIPLVVPRGFVVRVTASMSITTQITSYSPVDVLVIPQCRISNHISRESFSFSINAKLSGMTVNNYDVNNPPWMRTGIGVIANGEYRKWSDAFTSTNKVPGFGF